MMAIKKVPCLGPQQFITDIPGMMVKMFQQMFGSDESQSNLYFGSVTSFQGILSKNPNDIQVTMMSLQEKITTYYRNYFDDVTVDIRDITPDDTAKRTLQIDVIVSEAGKKYSLGAAVNASTDPVNDKFIISLDSGL